MTVVAGDDDSLVVKRVGIFMWPCLFFDCDLFLSVSINNAVS